MENPEKFDAIIIGTGQSGVPLAKTLAGEGWKTAIIERNLVGGSCINYGCTPSKTMAASAEVIHIVRHPEKYGVHNSKPEINLEKVVRRKREIVESFRHGLEKGIMKTENLDLIRGDAEFIDKKRIKINLNNGGYQTITADKIFINTGGIPVIPTIKGIESVEYLTSTSIMELEEKPAHLLILGGGYIGLEFGQMFRRFGSDVTIIERGPQILSHEDEDISGEIEKIMSDENIKIIKNSTVNEVIKIADNKIKLGLNTDNRRKFVTGTHFLVAAGRKPATKSLNLKAAGIRTDSKGYIKTNNKLETNVKGIYALGDVKGGPAFTHISYDDYRVIRDNLLRNKLHTISNRLVPYTVFIDPQLGRVGMTEKEAKKKNINYKVAKMGMDYVTRAVEVGRERGLMKAIVNVDTGKILGCSILGLEGGEIAAMIQVAMMGKLRYTDIEEGIFTHPTLSESLNTLFSRIK